MGIIQRKIDEIRKKPERVRVRYAWMYTAIVMVFVILIWIASFSSKNEETAESGPVIIQPEALNQFQKGKKSLQDTTDDMKGTFQGLDQQMPQGQNLNNIENQDISEGFGQ